MYGMTYFSNQLTESGIIKRDFRHFLKYSFNVKYLGNFIPKCVEETYEESNGRYVTNVTPSWTHSNTKKGKRFWRGAV